MKIAIVLGTRPEIIKMSPIIRECELHQLEYYILHTGQHYSYKMDGVFFKQLNLPRPKYNLEIGSGTHGKQTGKMIIRIEEILRKDPVTLVLVQGDSKTVVVEGETLVETPVGDVYMIGVENGRGLVMLSASPVQIGASRGAEVTDGGNHHLIKFTEPGQSATRKRDDEPLIMIKSR